VDPGNQNVVVLQDVQHFEACFGANAFTMARQCFHHTFTPSITSSTSIDRIMGTITTTRVKKTMKYHQIVFSRSAMCLMGWIWIIPVEL
jgi:hypothetical protein